MNYRSDERRCEAELGGYRCALPAGHVAFHAPLTILWQEAGYEGGPWATREGVSYSVSAPAKRPEGQ